MAEKVGKRISKQVGEEVVEFFPLGEGTISSPVRVPEAWELPDEQPAAAPAEGLENEYSPEFLELAEPKLPVLTKRNLGRLLMQSPNRLYFYWSIGKNPFHTLSRALGEPGSYLLVLRLANLRTGEERIHPVEEKGSWWFDVDADTEYQAEIGFYAVNRPYIRVLYSNKIATPRKSPSSRTAESAQWTVTSDRFARVLDVAGFARDAFDVALAGDDADTAETATRTAFERFSGKPHSEFSGIEAAEIRYAMLALASGVLLSELRGLISERLFAILSAISEPSGERALAVLKEQFEFDSEDFEIEEGSTEAVFGASIVSFPKKLKKPGRLTPLGPVSSSVFRK